LSGTTTGRDLSSAIDVIRRDYGNDLATVTSEVDETALQQLKFAELLPPELARATFAERLADRSAALDVIALQLVSSA
jgi:ATP-dependent Lhr-like helicase